MSEILTTQRGVSRAIWLSELAAALDAAQLLAKTIGEARRDSAELVMVKARIAATRAEVETLRLARGDSAAELNPDWMK